MCQGGCWRQVYTSTSYLAGKEPPRQDACRWHGAACACASRTVQDVPLWGSCFTRRARCLKMVLLRVAFDTEDPALEKILQSSTCPPDLHFLLVNLKFLKMPNCWSFMLWMVTVKHTDTHCRQNVLSDKELSHEANQVRRNSKIWAVS